MHSTLYRRHTIWRRIGSDRAVRYVCFESLREATFSVQSCNSLALPVDQNLLLEHVEQAAQLFNDADPHERPGSFPSLVEAIEAFEQEFGLDRDEGDGFDGLMDEVCVGLGFCGSGSRRAGTHLHVTKFIPEEGDISADLFVEWLFLADRYDPNAHPDQSLRLKGQLRRAFVKHMGAEVVDAKLLRWKS